LGGPQSPAGAAVHRTPGSWYFDAADRKGVLHVKIKPQPLAAGWALKITQ